MPLIWLIIVILVLAVAGFVAGAATGRCASRRRRHARDLHSLPSYYGFNARS